MGKLLILFCLAFFPLPASPLSPSLPIWHTDMPKPGEYLVDDNTKCFLDGKPCEFKDVPKDAIVSELHVKADRKTIVDIHFRSKP